MEALKSKLLESAEYVRGIARNNLQVEVNYDMEGVRWLDGLIQREHERNEPARRHGLIQVLGAFLGECIVRNIGGQWEKYEDTVWVRLGKESGVFPFHKVKKHLESGAAAGDSVLGFYHAVAAMNLGPLSKPQQRLLSMYEEGRDYHIYIGLPVKAPTKWERVASIKDNWVKGQENCSYLLNQIQSFYITYPSGGLIFYEGITEHLLSLMPKKVSAPYENAVPVHAPLALEELEKGKAFVEISYGRSTTEPDNPNRYSTTLRNVSSVRIRVVKFGGYMPKDGVWTLNTISKDFFREQTFREWYGQTTEWIPPGVEVCNRGNYGAPPCVWAYFCETETGESFIAGAELAALPPDPEKEQALNKLRNACAQTLKKMHPRNLETVRVPNPPWMKPADPLAEIGNQQMRLLAEGNIVWAALVQANTLLFSPGNHDCPAQAIYSSDPHFDGRIYELRTISSRIQQLKNTTPSDPEAKRVADLVTDEMDRSMNWKLPKLLTDKDVRSTTIMVYRKHIPNGVLTSGVFPILMHPSTEGVMIVPFEFWPIELIKMWQQKRL